MLIYVIYTCSLHICDMLDEVPFMASRGSISVLNNYFL